MSDTITMSDVTPAVLAFWFGGLDERSAETQQPFWFKSTPETDTDIRERFLEIHELAKQGKFDAEVKTPDDYLAIVIVLDQFPRNIHRGTPDAFATDPLALKWAKEAIAQGLDKQQQAPYRRMFLYLPFEHAENLDDQHEAVRLFGEMGDDELTGFAVAHRDVIERFGRFPHRNAVLGRVSTPDEEEYLSQPGAGW
ncbi:MAG: DUF924 domain-containing protein [Rhodospirillales bacterium]|nr:DUF924 domain-containing protein [Rhodospirillales bacterium]MBO6788164.1 DUF924 domain-containing protein [Rhodospirillales bacterium]